MAYDNTNSGALFSNKERRGERDPNARGTLNVEGTEYWISAWTKTSKAGDKYQSLSIQPKGEPKVASKSRPAVEDETPPFDDDLPF